MQTVQRPPRGLRGVLALGLAHRGELGFARDLHGDRPVGVREVVQDGRLQDPSVGNPGHDQAAPQCHRAGEDLPLRGCLGACGCRLSTASAAQRTRQQCRSRLRTAHTHNGDAAIAVHADVTPPTRAALLWPRTVTEAGSSADFARSGLQPTLASVVRRGYFWWPTAGSHPGWAGGVASVCWDHLIDRIVRCLEVEVEVRDGSGNSTRAQRPAHDFFHVGDGHENRVDGPCVGGCPRRRSVVDHLIGCLGRIQTTSSFLDVRELR
mmetsp:Transcript_66132/g.153595  ORF Transcript_66132/g.153595 Transcript_66132/m.153595 type:complete len:265 (+) Transcript_66132:721-1515(+)